MNDQSTVQETGAKSQALKILRYILVTAGVLLILFTFIMAIVRKFSG